MAARLLQRRSLAPLAMAALGSTVLLPATVYAEAPIDKRKPIYDDLEGLPAPSPSSPPKTLFPPTAQNLSEAGHSPSPTDRLAGQIGRARIFLYKCAVASEDRVNSAMDALFHLENSFTDTVASLAPRRESGEKLLPGAIYVLVAAMAGSILARNRNVLLRASMPLALGVGAGWAVLPCTMRNISELSWRYEQRFPKVAESHLRAREGLERGIDFARTHRDVGARYVGDTVRSVRETVEDWVKKGK